MALPLLHRRITLGWLGGLAASPFGLAQTPKMPFRMAVSDNYAPFYLVENGRARGIVIDILSEVVGKQMGIPIEFEAYPWARAQFMVEKSGYDALCTIANPNRLTYTVASDEPVLINNFHLFVHKDNRLLPDLRKVSAIDGLAALNPKAISYLGSGWSVNNLPGVELNLVGNFETVMRMLLARRADIMIDGESNVKNWLASHKDDLGRSNSEEIVMLPHIYAATRFDLLVSKKSAYLGMLPEFNVRMKAFRKADGYRKIFQSYGIRLELQRV